MSVPTWVTFGLMPLALASLTSCAVQRVSESFERSELQGQTAHQYNKFLENQQPEQVRDTVVFTSKPWVSTQPLVLSLIHI